MAHLIQVGVGSGGMPVLDLLSRDPYIDRVTLIEPDVYKPHNVVRHVFPASAVGRLKADLARDWLLERRPDLTIDILPVDLLAPEAAESIDAAMQSADLGVCAADNEQAKYHWDAGMRRYGIPWTLGEVLAGGIGGFVHRFVSDGPCYGCVASFLQRSVTVDQSRPPDYSQPGGPAPEVTIPASRTSIALIAALHAQVTLQLLRGQGSGVRGQEEGSSEQGAICEEPSVPANSVSGKTEEAANSSLTPAPQPLTPAKDFTSLLFTLEQVPGMFDEAFRTYRFRIPRSAECLVCRPTAEAPDSPEELDAALDQALTRLGNHA